MPNPTENSAETADAKHALDVKRYHLEVKKLAFERYKFRKDDRSLPKRLGLIVAIVASSITILMSMASAYLQENRARLDRDLTNLKAERDYKLQVAGIITATKDQLFSDDPVKQAVAIQTIRSTVPHQVYNRVFGQAAEQAKTYSLSTAYRDAQSIDVRWPPKFNRPFGNVPDYVDSLPPLTKTINGETTVTFCPLLNLRVSAEPLGNDEYRFTLFLPVEQAGAEAIDVFQITPIHSAFLTDLPNRPGARHFVWFMAQPSDEAAFAYIGKYPIDRIRVTTYRGPNFPKCETEVWLAKELKW